MPNDARELGPVLVTGCAGFIGSTLAEQLLSEYPNSKSAERARVFLDTINRKLGTESAP